MGNYNFVTIVAKTSKKAFSTAKLKKNPRKTINCKRSSSNEENKLEYLTRKDCSSEQEHKVNALALGAEEGRD